MNSRQRRKRDRLDERREAAMGKLCQEIHDQNVEIKKLRVEYERGAQALRNQLELAMARLAVKEAALAQAFRFLNIAAPRLMATEYHGAFGLTIHMVQYALGPLDDSPEVARMLGAG